MNGIQWAVAFGGVMAGAFLVVLAISIIPIVHLSVTVATAGFAIAIFTAGAVFACSSFYSVPSVSDIEEEKRADLKAAEILGDAEGGIYYFSTSLMRNLILRRQPSVTDQTIDENGNNLSDKRHPKLTDRLEYLRKWQAEHQSFNNQTAI
jgi:hypothetical protein